MIFTIHFGSKIPLFLETPTHMLTQPPLLFPSNGSKASSAVAQIRGCRPKRTVFLGENFAIRPFWGGGRGYFGGVKIPDTTSNHHKSPINLIYIYMSLCFMTVP